MAKKRRSNRNFVAIPVTSAITLSTLANGTVLTASLLGTLTEDLFVISADLEWTLRDVTAGEVPIEVGLAHSDYSVGEILENLDVSFLGPGSKIEQERARRLIRRSGIFNDGAKTDQEMGHGLPVKTKCKWVAQDGQDLNAFAVNRSGATLTTGAVIQIHGTVYGRWIV